MSMNELCECFSNASTSLFDCKSASSVEEHVLADYLRGIGERRFADRNSYFCKRREARAGGKRLACLMVCTYKVGVPSEEYKKAMVRTKSLSLDQSLTCSQRGSCCGGGAEEK